MVLTDTNHTRKTFLNGIDKITFPSSPNKNITAIITPHAGYTYCGTIMNDVYKLVDWSKFDKIIMLSTHHRSGNYLPQSTEFILNLTKPIKFKLTDVELNIEKNDAMFNSEHSWLVQMPFIDNSIPITIILFGTYDSSISEQLNKVINDKTFVIVNTDLLHCGNEYGIKCPKDIHAYNKQTIEMIKNKEDITSDHRMCGFAAIKTFIDIARKKGWISNEEFYTSSDVITGKQNSSVGYAGITFVQKHINGGDRIIKRNKLDLLKIPKMIMNFDDTKKLLVSTSTATATAPLSTDIETIINKFSLEYELATTPLPYGIFVTIENNGKLRGCIGDFAPTHETGKLIAKQTLESAFMDIRFQNNKINVDELSDLHYKINFLDKPIQVFSNTIDNEDPLSAVIHSGFKIGRTKGYGITLHFENNTKATYLASVLSDLGINILNSQTWNKLVKSLRNKAGGFGKIKRVDTYYCQEFKENDPLILDTRNNSLEYHYGSGCTINISNTYKYLYHDNKNKYINISMISKF
jgi:MEMO1 family protein